MTLRSMIGLSLFLGSAAHAQLAVSWHSIDGGGSMNSTGGTLSLSGTIGQPDAGVMTGSGFTLTGGFWAVGAASGVGVPAATLTRAFSRKQATNHPDCDIDFNLAGRIEDRTVTSEARAGGLTDLYLDFDIAPAGPGADPVTLYEQTGCPPGTPAAYAPYTGPAVLTPSLLRNQLRLQFSPALEGGKTYKLEISPALTSIAGQGFELRVLDGDVSSDGKTNGGDRSVVVGLWTSLTYACHADVNLDGKVNGGDRSVIVGVWTSGSNCAP